MISADIIKAFPGGEVEVVGVTKTKIHGERAIQVIAYLHEGKTVTGTFTTEEKAAFGGVVFAGRKDVVGLMVAKIDQVLRGTAERSEGKSSNE